MWHEFSWKFHVIYVKKPRQFDGNWPQISWKFEVTYPCFIGFPCWSMTWILDKFKSRNFHGICQENDGIFIGFSLIFGPNQTAVEKDMRKSMSHFWQGCYEARSTKRIIMIRERVERVGRCSCEAWSEDIDCICIIIMLYKLI